jgi:hypothetical protein
MKKGTNLIFLGLLSMLVGTVFASPLLISELEIRPFREPLPKGPTADVSVSVVYANYKVGDSTLLHTKNVTDISYLVVLNITNNSDEWAVVNWVNFDAAEEITQGFGFSASNSSFSASNSFTSVSGWEAKGAWVDGEWYNVTWVPHQISYKIPDNDGSEGYWMEGVQQRATYVGGELTTIHMNMNGTWMDVTGKIEVDGIEVHNFLEATTVKGIFFSEKKFLGRANVGAPSGIIVTPDMKIIETNQTIWASITTNVTAGFSNLWAPHQSRLIALSTSHQVITEFVEPSRLALLETGPIAFRLEVHHQINGTIGVYDSTSLSKEIKQVQMELTEDGYLYNTILSDNQMFVMDSFGVEAFIEPGN